MSKLRRKDPKALKGDLRIQPGELAQGPKDGFYSKLFDALEGIDFTGRIHRLCEAHYKAGTGSSGRPPTDPAVMFKMMMVGFLEGIASNRGIAARCADSLTIRRFLGYTLTEDTPDHSSFTVFRKRLPDTVFQAAYEVVLEAIRAHGLLKGRRLGIDFRAMEANTSLNGLARMDLDGTAAAARFDRARKGRKTSNKEWCNPRDPGTKVGRTKGGACDMTYKPNHTVDLEAGAIIAVGGGGDAGDTEDFSSRIIEAVELELEEEVHGQDHAEGASRVRDVIADKGFHSPEKLGIIQNETGTRAVIGDARPVRRRLGNFGPEACQAVRRVPRTVKIKSGRALLKKPGMHLERRFTHVPDCRGLSRPVLRDLANIKERYLRGILTFNLGLIMDKLTGVGTPCQAAAAFWAFYGSSQTCFTVFMRNLILEARQSAPVLIW